MDGTDAAGLQVGLQAEVEIRRIDADEDVGVQPATAS